MAQSKTSRVVIWGGTVVRDSATDFPSNTFFARGATHARLVVALKGPVLGTIAGTGELTAIAHERPAGGTWTSCSGLVTVGEGEEELLEFDITGDELRLVSQLDGTSADPIVAAEVSAQGYLTRT